MAGPMTLAQIVTRLGGRVAGASDTQIHQVGSLETADSRAISFYTGKRHRAKLDATKAGAVIVSPDCEGDTKRPRIVADNPYLYFARVSQLFNPLVRQPAGVHPSAVVAKSAKLGDGVSIGAGCVVGEDVVIGDGSCLYPRVVIYAGCKLGRRVIVHSGAVIGADGFGIADDNGHWVKIPQIGSVRIGDDVEIGANTTIDRGALDDTVIEEGVKLDNQIQIGHNTRIGAHTAIAGCVGIAGSADIGRHCTFGGAAMVLGHLTIVDHVNISAGTFISRSILKPGTYTGIYPVDEHEAWARGAAWLRRKGKKHE
ncbi:MAG TPA: UDP-3-O-(3-hydroxymyristoyl)glucosamine N-acyltransferase [Burkholderiales bacterium]|nr:UDP-3-O-(3-hydroxymyristoyl)glucosamine N-acyltransferase [Burkholderiales bacterium]